MASDSKVGVIKTSANGGIKVMVDHSIYINPASGSAIKDPSDVNTSFYRPITAFNQHQSTFYGLAKAAGDATQSTSSNAVGTYTEEAKTAIRSMLDVPSTDDIPEIPVEDVTIEGNSIVNNGIAEIPIAGIGQLGVAQTNPNFGTISGADGIIRTSLADATKIKTATNTYNPIVPSNQHTATFYGLAKAAGDSTQSSSSNAVGKYTDSAKTAIQSMLGVDKAIADAISGVTQFDYQITNELPQTGAKGTIYLVLHTHGGEDKFDEYIWINNGYEKIGNTDIDLSNYVTFDDYASASKAGVIKVDPANGLYLTENGNIATVSANSYYIKRGINNTFPITPLRINESTFYGLARAAGDSTQSASSNAVGTYTDEAKSAIKTMLGFATSSDISDAIDNLVNTRYYVCEPGEYNSTTYIPTLTGELGVIYLVPKPIGDTGIDNNSITGTAQVGTATIATTNNIFYEYIYTGDKFEQIGDTKVDLTGYITDADIATDASVTTMLNQVFS